MNSLFFLNQDRVNRIVIDKFPKFLNYSKYSNHSIYFPSNDLILNLLRKFPILFLHIYKNTIYEFEDCVNLKTTNPDH